MIECRKADLGEVALAAELRAEMALEMGSDFDALKADWRAAFSGYFGAKQVAGEAQIFLAFDGNTAVACTIVSILDDYRAAVFNTPSAFVNAVYVKRAYRRRGIARRMMRTAMAWARERACIRVRLRTSDEGRMLYAGLGFRAGREMEIDL